jgi:hypothetical protein
LMVLAVVVFESLRGEAGAQRVLGERQLR